jgi:ElaB/YqjD/DUF883 family membrane-anchored ribosome-binding protein
MTSSSLESATTSLSAIRDRASDAMRQAGHVAEEARLLQGIAADAFEDVRRLAQASVHTVKVASQRAIEMSDELRERIRERPLTALAITLGVGVSLGILYANSRPVPARRVTAV